MTGSTPSDAYHIPTVLPAQRGGWSRFWIPVITAALVVALGFLMVAATTTDDEPNPVGGPEAAAETVTR
jgi:hypothetical protein